MNVDEVAKLFTYDHLPLHLREVSRPFFDTAMHIMNCAPAGAMRDEALNDLWQSKNWTVAAVAQE